MMKVVKSFVVEKASVEDLKQLFLHVYSATEHNGFFKPQMRAHPWPDPDRAAALAAREEELTDAIIQYLGDRDE